MSKEAKKLGDDPAYPGNETENFHYSVSGLTKRELMALEFTKAWIGVLALDATRIGGTGLNVDSVTTQANALGLKQADVMLYWLAKEAAE